MDCTTPGKSPPTKRRRNLHGSSFSTSTSTSTTGRAPTTQEMLTLEGRFARLRNAMLGLRKSKLENKRYDHWFEIVGKAKEEAAHGGGGWETAVEDLLPADWMWEARVVDGKHMVSCNVCKGDMIVAGKSQPLEQHFLGKRHLAALESYLRKEGLICTDADISDLAFQKCIVAAQSGDSTTISKERLAFRVSICRLFHSCALSPQLLKNDYFVNVLAGSVPHQHRLHPAAILNEVPQALKVEEIVIEDEFTSQRNTTLLERGWVPYSVFHDGSDLFGQSLSCGLVRWVDEDRWVIQQRLTLVARSEDKPGSAEAIAEEIESMFKDNKRAAFVIGDGTNSQFKGMRLAAGDFEGRTEYEAQNTYNNGKGTTIVCIAHQLNNAGGRLFASSSTLGKFVSAWRTCISGYTGRVFRSAWDEFDRGIVSATTDAWYGKSSNPGSKTRWWTTWEMMADLFYHLDVLSMFSTSAYFEQLESEAAKTIRKTMEDLRRGHGDDFLMHLVAARVYGESLVNLTYALENEGFAAPLVAERVKELKDMLEKVAAPVNSTDDATALEVAYLMERDRFSVASLKKVRKYGLRMFMYTARVFGWRGILDKLEVTFETQYPRDNDGNPRTPNGGRDKFIQKSLELFEKAKICIPRDPHEYPIPHDYKEDEELTDTEKRGAWLESQWKNLIYALPAAARGVGRNLAPLLVQVEEDISSFAETDDAPVLSSDLKEAAEELWRWWGERRMRWPGLARVVSLVALILPSSTPVERAFSLTASKFTKLQHKMSQERSELTLKVAYNEARRRKERAEVLPPLPPIGDLAQT